MTIADKSYRSPQDLFDGAAAYYSRYQFEYPAAMFKVLRSQYLTDRSRDRLIDLGCGTGQLSVPLAQFAESVVAIDPNAGMIEQARAFGQFHGAVNIAYVEGRSEDISPAHGLFSLATIAGAFHWMDRARVLAILERCIKDQGAVAVILPRQRAKCEPEGWWEAQLDFTRKFWGGHFPAGKTEKRPQQEKTDKQMLLESTFRRVEEIEFPYEHHWNLDDFMGYAFSTSKANPTVLGGRREEFEAGLRAHLSSMSQSQTFVERGRVVLLLASRGAEA